MANRVGWILVVVVMLTFEARSLGLAWEIPMFCFQGELDIATPTAGHSTVFFADELVHLLNTHVRPRVMEATWTRY